MPPKDLESRVSALEVQVGELRGRVSASERDAAAARVLAGGADRDVGEIRGEIRDFQRATIGSFNALRQDMVDGFRQIDERFAQVNERFTQVNERFAQVDGTFGQVATGFAEMRAKFDMTAAGQQRIAELIQTVIDTQAGNGSE
ncbi:hypothetical protein [Mycobacterium sp. SMC-11]|uniref:hypothetical protein n=1 Tax=Mycobacterium sp. SMC-11 TaxID=3385969 RepID=UPI00390C7AA4